MKCSTHLQMGNPDYARNQSQKICPIFNKRIDLPLCLYVYNEKDECLMLLLCLPVTSQLSGKSRDQQDRQADLGSKPALP